MIERGIAALRNLIPFKHLQRDIEERQAVLPALPEAFSRLRAGMSLNVQDRMSGKIPEGTTHTQALSERVPTESDIILLNGKDIYVISPISRPDDPST